jgi:hypothetical protein
MLLIPNYFGHSLGVGFAVRLACKLYICDTCGPERFAECDESAFASKTMSRILLCFGVE